MWSSEYRKAIFLNNMITHATILSSLIFLILSQSHHTKFSCLKYIIYIHYFFSSMHDKNFERDEKILVYLRNRLLYKTTHLVIANIIGNIKFIFLFLESFLEKIVFGFLSGAYSFSLDLPGKTTSWIASTCSTIWEEVDDTSSLTT